MAEKIVVLRGDYCLTLKAVRHFCGAGRRACIGPAQDATVVRLTDEEIRMINREYEDIKVEEFEPKVHDIYGTIRRQLQSEN